MFLKLNKNSLTDIDLSAGLFLLEAVIRTRHMAITDAGGSFSNQVRIRMGRYAYPAYLEPDLHPCYNN